MSHSDTPDASAEEVPSGTDGHHEPTASLNADGTLNWFIPPYVIPAFVILLVIGRVIWPS